MMKEAVNQSDWAHLLVVVEFETGLLSIPSKALLGKGRELADQLGVWMKVYTDSPLSDGGKELISYGADVVFEDNGKDRTDRVEVLSKIIEKERPEIVLLPSSAETVALGARIAQRWRTGLATDCVSLTLDLSERRLVATRPLYDGKLLEELHWPARRPQMATVLPGAFPEGYSDPSREGRVQKVE